MYQDKFLQMDFQTAYTTTAASAYYIDMLAAADAMPDGTVLIFKSLVTTTYTGIAAGGTVTVQLQAAATTSFASDPTCITLASATVSAALLVTAGAQSFTAGQLATSIPSPLPTKAGYILTAAVPAFGALRYLQAYVIFNSGITVNAGASAGALTNELVITTDKILGDILTSSPQLLK